MGSFDLVFTELFCLTSPEKIIFNGDFNGDVASGIQLYFAECDSSSSQNCLSKEKKKKFFAAFSSIWIVTIQNNEEFVNDEYDNTKVIAGES